MATFIKQPVRIHEMIIHLTMTALADHKTIPKCFPRLLSFTRTSICMERVDAPTFKHALNQHMIPRHVQRSFLLRTLAILTELYEKVGFVHGDFHGNNVWIVNRQPILFDFGLSNLGCEDWQYNQKFPELGIKIQFDDFTRLCVSCGDHAIPRAALRIIHGSINEVALRKMDPNARGKEAERLSSFRVPLSRQFSLLRAAWGCEYNLSPFIRQKSMA